MHFFVSYAIRITYGAYFGTGAKFSDIVTSDEFTVTIELLGMLADHMMHQPDVRLPMVVGCFNFLFVERWV